MKREDFAPPGVENYVKVQNFETARDYNSFLKSS